MKHLDRIIRFVKAAGAAEEQDTDRNGFLSYHAESHAAGMGVAAGYAAVAFGQMSLLGILYAAAVQGRIRQSEGNRRKTWKDIKQEPHYALGGMVIGGILGSLTRLTMGQSGLPLGLLG